MLEHELTISILRFYKEETPNDNSDHCAVCTVMWESKDVIWLKGFNGSVQRKHLRCLLNWLIDNKVKLIKAHRSPKRVLPLAVENPSGYFEIKVQDLIDRFVKEPHGN